MCLWSDLRILRAMRRSQWAKSTMDARLLANGIPVRGTPVGRRAISWTYISRPAQWKRKWHHVCRALLTMTEQR